MSETYLCFSLRLLFYYPSIKYIIELIQSFGLMTENFALGISEIILNRNILIKAFKWIECLRNKLYTFS
jgi:hypothetical protein